MKNPPSDLEAIWSRHSAEWRDPAQICSQWGDASTTDPGLLEYKASRTWWKILADLGITLLVTREYEHLAVALSHTGRRPSVSYFPVPHPSGLAVDRTSNRVFLASTRNPNQVFTFRPLQSLLTPVASTFFPGSLYLHDLALIGTSLYGNAVGQNAVVRLGMDGSYERVWWPKSVEKNGEPLCDRNYIQLNSIAAGKTPRDSYFTASSVNPARLRPGHLNYPVDQQGVIFSGRTRAPICTGLTRPHSARLHEGKAWVANSGYGELGFADRGKLEVVARLPGWTRGLCIVKDIAFVATSRVIPRYAHYAPGLDLSASRCAVHAIDCKTGKLLGSLEWPSGNQVFAIDWIDAKACTGFPFESPLRKPKQELAFFYTDATTKSGKE